MFQCHRFIVAKNCDWRLVTEFFAKKKCQAIAEDGLFLAVLTAGEIATRRQLIFFYCSCAPCKRFSCSVVALLMKGEKDQKNMLEFDCLWQSPAFKNCV